MMLLPRLKHAVVCLMLCQSSSLLAAEKLLVVTTLPDIAEMVRAVGGKEVEVTSLLEGNEDAHYVDASPSFIRKVASADVVCIIGLDLEIGWIPKVLARSGRAQVQPGGQGYCELGSAVHTLDKPSGVVDRSMGDMHPTGNPHFNLSPRALSDSARIVFETLSRLRPDQKHAFAEGRKRFEAEMERLQKAIKARFALAAHKLKDRPAVIEYHKEFAYFFDIYGLKSFGSIEEKPGVPPSAARLAETALAAKAQGVKLSIGALYAPDKHLRKFEEMSGVRYKKLPTMVQNNDAEANSIEKVQNKIADAILQSL